MKTQENYDIYINLWRLQHTYLKMKHLYVIFFFSFSFQTRTNCKEILQIGANMCLA